MQIRNSRAGQTSIYGKKTCGRARRGLPEGATTKCPPPPTPVQLPMVPISQGMHVISAGLNQVAGSIRWHDSWARITRTARQQKSQDWLPDSLCCNVATRKRVAHGWTQPTRKNLRGILVGSQWRGQIAK